MKQLSRSPPSSRWLAVRPRQTHRGEADQLRRLPRRPAVAGQLGPTWACRRRSACGCGRRRIHRRACPQAEGAKPQPCGRRCRRHDRRDAADLVAVPRRTFGGDAQPHRAGVQCRRQPRIRQGFGDAAAVAARCAQDGRRQDRQQLPGRQGRRQIFEGAKFQWLSANVVVTSRMPAGLWRQALPGRAGGLHRHDAEGHAGHRSAHRRGRPVERDEATVNALVPKLRADHRGHRRAGGGVQSGLQQDINACEGNLAGSPIGTASISMPWTWCSAATPSRRLQLLAAQCPAVAVSSANAFGRVLSDIDLRIDPTTRDVVAVQVSNRLIAATRRSRPMPRWPHRQGIDALVAPRAAVVIARSPPSCPTMPATPPATCQPANSSPTRNWQPPRLQAFGGAAIAFLNRGGVRTPGFTYPQRGGEGDGNVTYGEAFTTQPFGERLVTMTLTAQDIKDVLEQQFARLPRPAAHCHAVDHPVGRVRGPERQQGLRRTHPFGDVDA